MFSPRGDEGERPDVGEPVGAGEEIPCAIGHAGAADWNAAEGRETLGDHLPGLLFVGDLAVDGVVHSPDGGVVVDGLRAEEVFGFGEAALCGEPEELAHGSFDECGFVLVGCGIFV
jgi:hypothetical protein